MKAYPTYKDSGIEWIGGIPKHWEIKPIKYVTSINDEVLPESFDPECIISYIDIGNVTLGKLLESPSKLKFKDAPSRARRIVKSGDTLVSTVRTYLKAITHIPNANENLIASTGFAVLTPKETNPKYLFYYAVAQKFIDRVCAKSVGVSYPAITSTELGNIPIWYPPNKNEQIAIANFLDQKTTEIDDSIEKRRELIELLKENRAAIINEAVTKGIKPDAPMRDSGIEDIGKIPKHWINNKLKRLAEIKGRIGFRGYTTSDLVSKGQGALTLGASHIDSQGKINLTSPVFISWEKFYESPEIMISKEDILIVQRGSTCGKIGYIKDDVGKATINPSLVLIKNIDINNKFLFYSLKSKLVSSEVDLALNSTAIPMLSQEQIGNFRVLVPSLHEQQKIVDHIESETASIDKEIEATQKEIELLEEYRQSLIAEAVTGKIDVRNYLLAN